MSKLSAFFEKKKKKVTKVTAPPELTQVAEKTEEPTAEDAAGWSLEPQQEAAWAAPAPSPASGGEGSLGTSLKVSAVGAYEIESKKDKSWSTMKKLEEEQRRGLQELREQEARELLLQQQQEQGIEVQQDTVTDAPKPQEMTPPKEEEPKLWVSARVLRSAEGGGLLRRGRGAPVPSFDDDPDLATAVQMVNTKQQPQHPGKKQQNTRKSPSEPNDESPLSTSPSTKCDEQQQQQHGISNISDSETSIAGPAAFVFDVQKYVSFDGLAGVTSPLNAELVRRKYENRPSWTTLTVAQA
ncbi:hypothetical protein, conserved [Eimeria necatrix]|uniref:Uncharacterized protein n=1 Tax=Eimeria necatrix TaxID=51315 RepID=U6N6L5_9EIME|nr:hypothetical protein, conserved [Eimeria necatrix]CDJ70340.1 hypothetical protein, conserved [Eimeria necatrix]